MKIIYFARFVFLLFLLVVVTQTAKSSDLDSAAQVVRTGSYSDLLNFVKREYEIMQVDKSNYLARSAFMYALSQVSLEKQLSLAIDFSLTQPDPQIRYNGAKAMNSALSSGIGISEDYRAKGINELRLAMEQLQPSAQSLNVALAFVDTLILLKSDLGLDVLLTSSGIVRSYDVTDNWDLNSDQVTFNKLSAFYNDEQPVAGGTNLLRSKVRACFYELCAKRREQGLPIKPVHPILYLEKFGAP